jgi:hypothetical protein
MGDPGLDAPTRIRMSRLPHEPHRFLRTSGTRRPNDWHLAASANRSARRLRGSEIRFGAVTGGQSGGDVVLVGESAEDLLPADPVLGEVDRFGPPSIVYRFRTHHRCGDLRIGRISRLRKRSARERSADPRRGRAHARATPGFTDVAPDPTRLRLRLDNVLARGPVGRPSAAGVPPARNDGDTAYPKSTPSMTAAGVMSGRRSMRNELPRPRREAMAGTSSAI